MDAHGLNTVHTTKSGWVLSGDRTQFRLNNTNPNISEIVFNAPPVLSKYPDRSFHSYPAISLVDNRPHCLMIGIQWYNPPNLFLWKRNTKVYSTDLRKLLPGINEVSWKDVASFPAKQEKGALMHYDDEKKLFTLQFTDDATGAEAHTDFRVDADMAVTPSATICDSSSTETRLDRMFSDGSSSGGSVTGGGGSSSGGGGNAYGGSRFRPIAMYDDEDDE